MHEDGSEIPLAFASKAITDTQSRYSVTEIECLAVLFGVEKFRPYLEGRFFTLITDHNSLKWLMELVNPSARLQRWALKLQEFTFNIQHAKARDNTVPDVLSRNPVEDADFQLEEGLNNRQYVNEIVSSPDIHAQ